MSCHYTLLFLGSGSAFTLGGNNWQSNLLLIFPNGKKFLIDCGTDVRHSLYEQGLSFQDIDAVYVTHLHSDHVGGLEWLAFSNHFFANHRRIPLFIDHSIEKRLWEQVLSGGLSTIEGQEVSLDFYFQVESVHSSFRYESVVFEQTRTRHTITDSSLTPCFGLFFQLDSKRIYLSADTSIMADSQRMMSEADMVFHDCETSQIHSGVHAHYQTLRELPKELKKKIWLYHYQPGNLPDAKQDGFQGFVKKGQRFEIVLHSASSLP